jgi:histidine ammonia-lyase
MATFAARRLGQMAHNTSVIVGIELLAAAQGIDFHRPLTSSRYLEEVHARLRTRVARFDEDRFFAPDIEAARRMVVDGELSATCKELFAALHR